MYVTYSALYSLKKYFSFTNHKMSEFGGTCNHGMVRPQVADGRTASDMEGKCEYIE
jgi:hypothetical protein